MKNKQYLFSLDFWAAAAHRALWTGAQTVLATVATAKFLSDLISRKSARFVQRR